MSGCNPGATKLAAAARENQRARGRFVRGRRRSFTPGEPTSSACGISGRFPPPPHPAPSMPATTPKVTLKPGHVQPVWMGHPWVYAQAIDRIEGGATAGDEVSVHDPRGNLLGRGFYSPGSAIPVRLLTRDAETHLDAAFFRARIERATALRASLGLPSAHTTGFRLVHAEGDGLPGLVVDKYGDALAVQVGTIGMKQREAVIHEALWSVAKREGHRGPHERADGEGRGVHPHRRRRARHAGDGAHGVRDRRARPALPAAARARSEDRLLLRPAPAPGTRRDARARQARARCVLATSGRSRSPRRAAGRPRSSPSTRARWPLEVGAECARANGVGRQGEVREAGRAARARRGARGVRPRRRSTRRGWRRRAGRASRRSWRTRSSPRTGAARRGPGGILVLCSCSAAVDLGALTRALAQGATRANVQATVLERWFQGADHPVPAAFGEGLT